MINGREIAGFVAGFCGASAGLVAGVNRIVSMKSMDECAASARKISVELTWDVVVVRVLWVWQEVRNPCKSRGHNSRESGRWGRFIEDMFMGEGE